MYINITDSETGNNKGSSGRLVHYLEKENHATDVKERWFNHLSREIIPQEVRIKIDHNVVKLGRDDAKFFLINISPSQKEIASLKEKFGDQGAEEKLKDYAISVMDAYAQNFKRDGINSSKDLLWYGKLERYRYYHHKDPEVKQGLVKAGQKKEGEQLHIQIIVSRKDITNRIKLSPMNNSRGKNKAHSAKLGQFDRVAFKASGERIFDEMFSFDRSLKDTLNYAITMKNGSAEQKKEMYLMEHSEGKLKNERFETLYNKSVSETKSSVLLDILGSIGSLLPQPEGEDLEEREFERQMKKKKKRRRLN